MSRDVADSVKSLVKKQKIKRRNTKTDAKTKQHSRGQFTSIHYVRRFETAERFCEAICIVLAICVSGMPAFGAHRLLIAWTIGLAIIAAILAWLFWYTDKELDRRATEQRSPIITPPVTPTVSPATASPRPRPSWLYASPAPSPTETPKVTETPTATPTPTLPTTPTPEIKSETPYVPEMTSEQVGKKLREATQRGNSEPIRKALVNMRVDWKLLFWDAKYTDDNTQVSAFFIWRSAADAPTTDLMVSFELPMKGHERLPLRDRYFEFRIEGVIDEVIAAGVVHLKEVRITPNQ